MKRQKAGRQVYIKMKPIVHNQDSEHVILGFNKFLCSFLHCSAPSLINCHWVCSARVKMEKMFFEEWVQL